MALLELHDLNKSFGDRHVVQDVSLEVEQGELVGLLGPNGAGKTTTFRMAVGMLRPDSGRVMFDGHDISRQPMYRRARRGIGYLAQRESIFSGLTVEENILAILETLKLERKERKQRLEQSIGEFGLQQVRRSRATTLSGGERRRLEVARALVTQPKLIFFDEPFYGVDPIATEDIQRIIYEFHRRGTSVLLTDHDARKVLAIIDRAYIIRNGTILTEGSSEQILNDEMAVESYLGESFTMDLDAERKALKRAASEGLSTESTRLTRIPNPPDDAAASEEGAAPKDAQ
jgi:lipopolysaccharide export system ATP-binding protein